MVTHEQHPPVDKSDSLDTYLTAYRHVSAVASTDQGVE